MLNLTHQYFFFKIISIHSFPFCQSPCFFYQHAKILLQLWCLLFFTARNALQISSRSGQSQKLLYKHRHWQTRCSQGSSANSFVTSLSVNFIAHFSWFNGVWQNHGIAKIKNIVNKVFMDCRLWPTMSCQVAEWFKIPKSATFLRQAFNFYLFGLLRPDK